jgi:hypothetical protein
MGPLISCPWPSDQWLGFAKSPTSLAITLDATGSSPRLGDREDDVDGQQSEESGVLTDNLAVKGGASRLDVRVAVREFDGDNHGLEDLNDLGGCLVELPSPAAESWDLESSTSILAAGWIEDIHLVVQMDLHIPFN